jgi:hypothetical protein
LQLVAGGVLLVMMLRPFLKHISKESRRCAELLAQLPPDMDVEGMVAATWSVVKQVRPPGHHYAHTSFVWLPQHC